jgi:hypothetical protein
MKCPKFFIFFLTLSITTSALSFPLVFKRSSVVGEQRIPFQIKNNVPLLQGFEFSFDGNGVDNHIKAIGTLPTFNRTGFALNFQDDGNDDLFSYKYALYLLPSEGIAQHSIKGRCIVSCIVPIPANAGIFALTGFQLRFINGDRHIGKIGIEKYVNNTLIITLADQNSREPFQYEIHFAYLPESRVSLAKSSSRIASHDYDILRKESGKFILSGFYFEFPRTDHHLKTIGVYPETDSRIKITFRDENGDDPFKWVVYWLNLK